MKSFLILFGCVEASLLITFILFLFSEKNTWLYPMLLILLALSFALGSLLLFLKKKP